MRQQKHQVLLQLEPAGEGRTRLVLTSLGFGAGQELAEGSGYGATFDIALQV